MVYILLKNAYQAAKLSPHRAFLFITSGLLINTAVCKGQANTNLGWAAEIQMDRFVDGPRKFINSEVNNTFHVLQALRIIHGKRGRSGSITDQPAPRNCSKQRRGVVANSRGGLLQASTP